MQVEMTPVHAAAPAPLGPHVGRSQRAQLKQQQLEAAVGAPPAAPPFSISWFTGLGLAWQVALIVLYGTTTVFAPELNAGSESGADFTGRSSRYSMWMDVHIMMLVGFGFLYTLLRRYAWSGVSWNFLIVVYVLQWALLCIGFWRNVCGSVCFPFERNHVGFPSIPLSISSLIDGDYAVAAVLISMGALLGRVSATQMLVMGFVETIVYSANYTILQYLLVADAGGSMVIHTLGASFGLAVSYVLGDNATDAVSYKKLATTRTNGTFAMIGTVFLFALWPSFNAALFDGAVQTRIVINTVISICASACTAFAVSMSIGEGKFLDMEAIQNATLAGGVAIGVACQMLNNVWGAALTGMVAGAVSVCGFAWGARILRRNGLTDTCGIAWLHLVPGMIGGVAGAIAMAGVGNGTGWSAVNVNEQFPGRVFRSAVKQGGYCCAFPY